MTQLFPVTENIIHLNHAAVGPWPAPTAAVVRQFAEENAQQGSLDYPRWLKTEKSLRDKISELINAESSDEIALVKNTSEGLSFIAYGLDWRHGDNVVGIEQEFPSNRFVWDSLASRGVEFRKLDMDAFDDPEQALFDLCDACTRVISISAVQYHNGYRMDLERIGAFCHDNGILFCVDAIQQIGALPFDVQAIQADFAVADGHKWMVAPEGLGLMYVRREVIDRLALSQYGWHMVSKLGDYSEQQFSIEASARRFEAGSPNMLGIHALDASLAVLLDEGMDSVGRKVLDNSRYLLESLAVIEGVELLSDRREKSLSGIITFRHNRVDARELYRHLGEHSVLCAPRGGGIRLSPHFYTPRSQLEQVVSMVDDLVR